MADIEQDTLRMFEERALEGDGQFAIAFALLTISQSHANLVRDLCFGKSFGDGYLYPGVLEKVGMELESIASAIRETVPSE